MGSRSSSPAIRRFPLTLMYRLLPVPTPKIPRSGDVQFLLDRVTWLRKTMFTLSPFTENDVTPTVDDAVWRSFAPLLATGERLLWSGCPRPFWVMRSKAAHVLFGMSVIVLFSMTPMRGTIIAVGHAVSLPAMLVHGIISGSVLAVALYSILVPFLSYWRARRISYAVTNRRVLVLSNGTLTAVAGLDEVQPVVQGAIDGATGDIRFFRPLSESASVGHLPQGFYGIAHPEHVYRILLQASAAHTRGTGNDVPDYLDFLIRGKRPRDLSD